MTVVVFLHGVGGPPAHWAQGLVSAEMAGEAWPDGIVTREIRYDDLVARKGRFGQTDLTPPELVISTDGVWGTRGDYLKRQGQLRGLVHNNSTTVTKPTVEIPTLLSGDALVRLPALRMRDAGHYRYNPEIRSAVLDRIGSELRATKQEFSGQKIVLLAHSFGSVIALDLLHSTTVDLAFLVTIGSPLGVGDYWSPHWQGEGRFPYSRLGGWLNLVNLFDPISWQRGVSSRFPQAVDAYIKIGTGVRGTGGYHDPATYLSSQIFLAALRAVDNLEPGS